MLVAVLAGGALLMLAGCGSTGGEHRRRAAPSAPVTARPVPPPVLRVAGNHFVDRRGRRTRLFPMHLGTAEFVCVQPVYGPSTRGGVFAVPTTSAVLAAMRSWHANAVRLSLNEQCWLGANPVRRGTGPRYGIEPLSGAAARVAGARLRSRYRAAVRAVVARAHRAGLAVVLDLHWSAAGEAIAYAQWPLPDRQYSIPFWRSVARTFRDDRSVLFEIFNEPIGPKGFTLTWRCLRDGCRVPNGCEGCAAGAPPNRRGCGRRCPTFRRPLGTYGSAGTQELVDTIRATGARQPILVPGRYYTNDLRRWLRYEPRDPLHQLAASLHVYEFVPCADEACWTRTVAPVAARVPVVTTEFGGDKTRRRAPCAGVAAFDRRFMDWADAHGISYGGFRWSADFFHFPYPQCSYDLLAKWDGTPRYGHGRAIHDHLVRVAPS